MIPKIFDDPRHIQRIVLVGVGGTGGHLARLLVRMLYHLSAQGMRTPTLCLVDPDRVESHNVGRQLFSPAEMGQFKSEAMARRLSCAFGLAVEYITEPFSSQHTGYGTLLIDAVDNHHARQAMARTDATLLACGNHADAGQVSIGNANRNQALAYLAEVRKREAKQGVKDTLNTLPNAYALFPELLEPDPEPVPLSCAERVAQNRQDLFINDTVALVAARYVQQLLTRQPITSFLTFVNLARMTTIAPVPITLDTLYHYLERTHP